MDASLWTEILSACVSLACYLYKPSHFNKWFVLFLSLTVVVELTGYSFPFASFKIPMYNGFLMFEFVFYSLFMRSFFEKQNGKKILNVVIAIFLMFSFLNLFFVQGIRILNTNMLTAESIILIAICMFQYIEMINDNNELSLNWPLFCVITGVLIFYSANLFNTAIVHSVIKRNSKDLNSLFLLINHSSNVVLYGLFTVAFCIEVYEQKEAKFKTDPQQIDVNELNF